MSKPCPFCGGESLIIQDIAPHGNTICQTCGARTPRTVDWNKRPVEDALRAELDQCFAWAADIMSWARDLAIGMEPDAHADLGEAFRAVQWLCEDHWKKQRPHTTQTYAEYREAFDLVWNENKTKEMKP